MGFVSLVLSHCDRQLLATVWCIFCGQTCCCKFFTAWEESWIFWLCLSVAVVAHTVTDNPAESQPLRTAAQHSMCCSGLPGHQASSSANDMLHSCLAGASCSWAGDCMSSCTHTWQTWCCMILHGPGLLQLLYAYLCSIAAHEVQHMLLLPSLAALSPACVHAGWG